ncbi:hypothetical protein DFH08DRAFT_974760 [Mycena albidolilacea]|uniref:Uncharacterized protein n=1 Tax=Mycena albidolilacea TaxID=1033008 RepID=A0AAD6Z6Z3_9AGAR|nr:hypothetical protein DFH08DRAFT_974760 [Mycena albidolilacea]
MSSFNAFGFFALAAGRRVPTQLPGATYPIHHCHYTTSLKSSDNVNVAATLRVYSAAGDAPLPDNTIIFAVAKVYAPAGKPVDLVALYISAIPGDVNTDEYENTIPECPTFVYGVGHIPHNHTAQVFPDSSKAFTISISEYVNGSPKSSVIQCVFPATRRWLNVPSPRALSCTHLAPHILSQSGADTSTIADSPETPATPARRRKYAAIGSLSTSVVTPVHNTGAATLGNPVVRPASPFNAVAGPGPSTTSTYKTRSKKRRASTQSIPPTPDDGNDTDVADATPVKSKGKKAKR